MNKGQIPSEFKNGVVSCLPKVNSPVSSYANVRPITLLEHIKLKLVTRVLMRRIDKVLAVNGKDILHPAQYMQVLKGAAPLTPSILEGQW